MAELQKLAALKDAGVLTDAEFTAAKGKLLA
ncbi:SHOCT domain-containing protein [Herbiconiux sp.]|nr:SHOCT domain-containing protein [Herbiconiux sp.]